MVFSTYSNYISILNIKQDQKVYKNCFILIELALVSDLLEG